jgi:hypothetical protein
VLLHADNIGSRNSQCGAAPRRSRSNLYVQLRREQQRRRSIESQLTEYQRSYHTSPQAKARRAFSSDSLRPSGHHPAAYVGMNGQCFFCEGFGCHTCNTPQSTMWNGNFDSGETTWSPPLNPQLSMSPVDFANGSLHPGQGYLSGYGESFLSSAAHQRRHTDPLDVLPTWYHNASTMYEPQPVRRASSNMTSMPQNPQIYPGAVLITDYPGSSNVDGSYNIHSLPQVQSARRTSSNVVSIPTHHQTYVGAALNAGFQNLSNFGGFHIVQPVLQSQSANRSLSQLAPKPDKIPQDHGSVGHVNYPASSHSLYSQWKCMLCGKKCHNQGNLNRHNNHHCPYNDNKERYNCNDCDKDFARADLVTKHVKRTHKKVACDTCSLVFNGDLALSKHMRDTHDVAGDNSVGL